MTMRISRLRMFAGPNGSGKSTIKSLLDPDMLGIYINPDDIQHNLQQHGFIDFKKYSVVADDKEIYSFFDSSTLLKKENFEASNKYLNFEANKLFVSKEALHSYTASVLSDFIRRKLVAAKASFSFETVMSSPDKIAFLKQAQSAGFRTYLYYIATEDPQINIDRVDLRIKTGGHAVPIDKIISRYERSLSLLSKAIGHTNRAYIFDNSFNEPALLAEINDGKFIQLKADTIPAWFEEFVQGKIDLKAE